MSNSLTTEEWIRECTVVHGGKYNYSKVIYRTAKKKVCIMCPEHGEFWQGAHSHKKGVGCPECAVSETRKRKRALAGEFAVMFEARSREIHGDFYDYSKVVYETARKKVCIVCPIHGEFWQVPHNHIEGHGCPECKRVSNSIKNSSNNNRFIVSSNKRHGNKYLYSNVDYKAHNIQVIVTCSTHGDFLVTPNAHLSGQGCPICKKEETAKKVSEEGGARLVTKGSKVHSGKYSYSKVVYVDYDTPVLITCPTHGDFWQTPDKHLSGCGCPKCSVHVSHRESDLVEYLSMYFQVVERDRKMLKGKELDIYIPDKKIAVEYNGSIFHSEKYNKEAKWHMRNKQDSCELLGIRLIHVSDSEDQEVVKKTLARILGIPSNKYMARKCEISEESYSNEIENFLEEHHLQGRVKKCRNLCLRHEGELVAIGCFSRTSSARGVSTEGQYELRRYCSDGVVVGGLSKIISHFIKSTKDCFEIVTYSDNRWFDGESYNKVGFTLVKNNPPDYMYVSIDSNKSVRKKGKMRRAYLDKMPDIIFDPRKTEVENCRDNGWYRIWDCGKKKWSMQVK